MDFKSEDDCERHVEMAHPYRAERNIFYRWPPPRRLPALTSTSSPHEGCNGVDQVPTEDEKVAKAEKKAKKSAAVEEKVGLVD
jgi:hypothetical protein